MKKFWWGIFFGALIGVLLLAPDSNFSANMRDLFKTAQYTVADVLFAATEATGRVAQGVEGGGKF